MREVSLPEILTVQPTIEELRQHISWSFFFAGWGLKGRYPDIFADPDKGAVARELYADATAMLKKLADTKALHPAGKIGAFHATADGDDLILYTANGMERWPMHRSAQSGRSITDFVGEGCTVRLFAMSGAFGLDEYCNSLNGDDYDILLAKTLAGRLAEAMADKYLPAGCRLAVGYPALPAHALKRDILRLVDPESELGFTLTETCMLVPCQSVIGIHLPQGEYI